jgi:riboflavin synthase
VFTGIIEEVGTVGAFETRGAGGRLRIRAPLVAADLRAGDSIAVNGVCLTAAGLSAGEFGADVSPETLSRSDLGRLRPGSPVNLERALRASSRLGGHIVQGHADGVGTVESFELVDGENRWLKVRVPGEIARYLVFKGPVAIDGISLTVARLEDAVLSAAIIPHTYFNTNLRAKRPGDSVNLESDILAKYVEKIMSNFDLKPRGLTVERLRGEGF